RFLSPEAERSDHFTVQEATFIEARDGFYQATVTETGWPYVQFKGGPVGFVKVLDSKTLGYADFRGNRQYISLGNLKDDDRLSIIFMDYVNQARLKLLGHARAIEIGEDQALVDKLMVPEYRAQPERAVLITLEGYDWNCPAHIPQRLTLSELDRRFEPIREELTRLRAENEALRSRVS
ncbi:MAG: pyridoxamine 5'-phosphate oxidase family protein, partial [Pseudomonadota bacterium]